MAFDAGIIKADLTLNRTQFTKGLEAARRQARQFADKTLTKTVRVNTQVNKENFKILQQQLETYRKSKFTATAALNVEGKPAFTALRNQLRQFDNKTYDANVSVDTKRASGAINKLSQSVSNYFNRVSGRAYRIGMVRMAAFRSVATSSLTAIVPAAASATAAIGGLTTAALTAGAGFTAFAAVAIPQLAAIADETEKGQVKFSELRKELHPLARNVQRLIDAFMRLQAATRGAVNKALIAGIDALIALMPAIVPLVVQTAKALTAMGKALEKAFKSKAFQNFIKLMANNLGPLMGKMFSIFGSFTKVVAGLMRAFMPMANWILDKIAAGMKEFAKWAGQLANSSGFKAFIDYAKQNLPLIANLIFQAARAFLQLAKAVAPIGTAVVKGLTKVFNVIAGMDPKLLAAIAAGITGIVTALTIGLSPIIGSLVGGVVALTAALAILGGGFGKLPPILQKVVRFFRDIWNKVVQVAKAIWVQIKPALMQLWKLIQTQLIPAFSKFLDAIKPVVMWFIDFMKPIITSVIKSVIGILKGFVKIVTGIFKVFTGILTGNWSKAWNGIQQIFEGVVQAVWNFLKVWLLGKIFKVIKIGLRWIKGLWNKVWGAISGFTKKIWGIIWGFIRSIWNRITGWLGKRLTSFKNFWKGIWNTIWGFIRSVWNSIWKTIRNVWNSIVGWFKGAWDSFVSYWRTGWNDLVDMFSNIFGGIVKTAKGIWSSVKGAFKTGINAVIGFLNSTFIKPLNKLLGVFNLEIPTIPPLAKGGRMTNVVETQFLASGGRVGSGFMTNRPTAIVGEGNPNYPEYVIPTDPRYRGRARGLYNSLGTQLMASGGMVPGGKGTSGNPYKLDIGDILGGIGDFFSGAGSFMWERIKDVGQGLSWLGSKAWGFVQKGLSWTMTNAVQPIVDSIKSILPNNFIGDVGKGMIDKAVSYVRDILGIKMDKVKEAQKKVPQDSFGGRDTFSGGGSGQWRGTVMKALSILGLPKHWADNTMRQIMIESGGNPRAVNRWDINAMRGTPSKGLLQTIGPTFRAHNLPGLGGIFNPLANIVAAMRYSISRYGSLGVWPTTGGYDNGGGIRPGWSTIYNGTGRVENVQSPQTRDEQTELLKQIIQTLIETRQVVVTGNTIQEDTLADVAKEFNFQVRHQAKEAH